MIDIHAHIMPGVDDGAADMSEAIEMAYIAQNCGVTDIIATPHCNVPGSFKNYFGAWYNERFHQLQEAISREGLDIRIHPGMEVYATYDLPRLLREEKILTLCESHYLLVEFDMTEEPDFADRILEDISAIGVWPVIAHAERYQFVQEYPDIAYEWKKKGYVIQVNKGSVMGRFGRRARQAAYNLLDRGLAAAIASDAHGAARRTTYLSDAYEALEKEYTPARLTKLFKENPGMILRGRLFRV